VPRVQPRPHTPAGLVQFGLLLPIQLAAFLNRLNRVVHLVNVHQTGNRRRDGGVGENVSQGQPRAPVVVGGMWAIRRTVPREERIIRERLDAEHPHVILPDRIEEAVGGEFLLFAV